METFPPASLRHQVRLDRKYVVRIEINRYENNNSFAILIKKRIQLHSWI
jgi:hypothetical protein